MAIRKGEFLPTSKGTPVAAAAKSAGVRGRRSPAKAGAQEAAAAPETSAATQAAGSGSRQPEPKEGSAPREVPTRPTHKLRLRALSNRIKSKLLGATHDPAHPQAKEVVAAAVRVLGEGSSGRAALAASLVDSPVVDRRTFEKWWHGTVGRVWTPKLEACDRLAKGSSLWLTNSCYGEPIQRHFDALDVRCDDRMPKNLESKGGVQWLSTRMELMDKSLQAADRCWSVFSHRAAPSGEALALMAQVVPGGTIPSPSLRYAPSAVQAEGAERLAKAGFNCYLYEADIVARHLHNASSKFGLLRYLLRIGAAAEGARPWWHTGWVFDLASVAAMAQFFAVFGPTGSPESNVGEDVDLIFAINRVFFDHDEGTYTPFITDLPELAKRLDLPPFTFVRSLLAARREYYATLEALGISFEDVYRFAKPVELVGAKTIRQNMIWDGQAPAGRPCPGPRPG